MILLEPVRHALSGQYRIERELGSGGMATVYLADDLRHARQVAVKVLHPEVAALVGVDRFLREIQVTAGLQHPHILPLHDSGSFEIGGTRLPYYVSPVVEGESLRDRLEREKRLPAGEAVRIATQVAAALAYAHSRGVIHRDIKPDNILLHHGLALLADFGIALETEDTNRLTTVGLTVGTVAYMSPEQASGERNLDGRSDVYSLAAVLFEMLAGEPPFTGPNPRAVLARQLSESAPSVRRLRPEVPETLDRVLSHALSAEPDARFPSAAAFAAALQGEIPVPKTARRAGRWLAVGALAGLVIVAAVAGWGLLARGRRAPDGGLAGDLTRRGWIQLDRRTVEGTSRAVSLFRSAIASDSGYADAWAGLALALQHATIWHYAVDGVPKDSIAPLTIQASARAIEADSTNARAWVARTYALRLLEPGSRANMIAAGERAVRLDPGSVDAWHYLGLAREENLEPGPARLAYGRALALVPGHLRTLYFLGLHFMWARQSDSSLVWADSTVRVDPTYLNGRQTRGIVRLLRGDLDQAEEDFRASLPLGTRVDMVATWTGLANVALLRGRADAAAHLLDTAVAAADTVKPSLHDATYLAWGFSAAGRKDLAIRMLERFAARRDRHFQLHLKRDPMLDPLRSDPRFSALMLPDE